MLEESIIAYAGLGIQIMITELDVTTLPKADDYTGADISLRYEYKDELNPFANGLPVRMQYRHAACYADLFTVFHKHADKISRVTFWGVQDGNSWRNNWPVPGRRDYSLLFDRDCKPKLPFHAIIQVAESDK
jgi:endo-1,4-beta-xylanase